MKLQLDFFLPESELSLTHKDSFLLLGSCFASSMEEHFHNRGFYCVSNPFGVIFHPIALANLLNSVLENDVPDSFQREDMWFSWRSASSVFGFSESEFQDAWNGAKNELLNKLKSSSVLVLTFGTSWGYRLKSNGEIVSNCHKMPNDLFDKELSSVNEMQLVWKNLLEKIRKVNPDLKVIFTVSPVRHIKDGLIENNRSKANLISLVHELCEAFESAHYFPSYEIVNDALRDYRFFKEDLVHPNESAVKYVFEAFQSWAFLTESVQLGKKVHKINIGLIHRPIHSGSKADLKRIEKLEKEKNRIDVFWKGEPW